MRSISAVIGPFSVPEAFSLPISIRRKSRPRAPQHGAGGDQILEPLVLDEGADIADHRHRRRDPQAGGERRVAAARREPFGIAGIGQERDGPGIDAAPDQFVAHRSGEGEDVIGAPGDLGLQQLLDPEVRAPFEPRLARLPRHFPEPAHLVEERQAQPPRGDQRRQGGHVVGGGDHPFGAQSPQLGFQGIGRRQHVVARQVGVAAQRGGDAAVVDPSTVSQRGRCRRRQLAPEVERKPGRVRQTTSSPAPCIPRARPCARME